MYNCEEEGVNSSPSLEKETLQLSPHIAAHKSSGSNFINIPIYNENLPSNNQQSTRLIALPSSAVYKLNIPSNHLLDSQYSTKNQKAIISTSPALPQDLSSGQTKTITITTDSNTPSIVNVKNFQDQTVANQVINCISGSLVVAERPSALFNISDGAAVTIGQQSVFVSNGLTGSDIFRHRNDTNSIMVGDPSDLTTIPYQSGMNEGDIILPDFEPGTILYNTSANWHVKEIQDKKHCKDEDDPDQKDLVRQALQAAVAHNSPKINNEDIMSNQYGLLNDQICHSTFSIDNHTKEMVMMNVGPIGGGQKIIGTLLPTELGNGTQFVVLQASAISESSNGSVDLSKPRKRSREGSLNRRRNVSNKCKEKRANESEEQKARRRVREAERMRRKRSAEDEDTKQIRRLEAAQRARRRRANLSPIEKEMERKKAAVRMRLRRRNENEDERKRRRDKAAERMRMKRATETPEEKAQKRQGMRTSAGKPRLKFTSPEELEMNTKPEDLGEVVSYVKSELTDIIMKSNYASNIDNNSNKSKRLKNDIRGPKSDEATHMLPVSNMCNPSANFTLVNNDDIHEDRYIFTDFGQGHIQMDVKNLTSESQRIGAIVQNCENVENRRYETGQSPPSYSESVSPMKAAEVQTKPLPLQKIPANQMGIHHQLPHLIHPLSNIIIEDHPYNTAESLNIED